MSAKVDPFIVALSQMFRDAPSTFPRTEFYRESKHRVTRASGFDAKKTSAIHINAKTFIGSHNTYSAKNNVHETRL